MGTFNFFLLLLAASANAINGRDISTIFTEVIETVFTTEADFSSTTIYNTDIFTVTSCAPTITDCPASVITTSSSISQVVYSTQDATVVPVSTIECLIGCHNSTITSSSAPPPASSQSTDSKMTSSSTSTMSSSTSSLNANSTTSPLIPPNNNTTIHTSPTPTTPPPLHTNSTTPLPPKPTPPSNTSSLLTSTILPTGNFTTSISPTGPTVLPVSGSSSNRVFMSLNERVFSVVLGLLVVGTVMLCA